MLKKGRDKVISAIKKHRRSAFIKQVRGHIDLLRKEESLSEPLNGAVRIQMIVIIRHVFHDDAGTLSELGVASLDELAAIVTDAESRTLRDAKDDRTLWQRSGLSRQEALSLFREFLHDITTKSSEPHARDASSLAL